MNKIQITQAEFDALKRCEVPERFDFEGDDCEHYEPREPINAEHQA